MAERSAGDPRLDRRRFFGWGVGIIAALFSMLLGVPLVGFAVSALLKRPPEQWERVTSLDQIDSLEPRLFRVSFRREDAHMPFEDARGVFVIRRGEEILAFTNVCTHMGCSVRWLDWRQQILCPCHGGVYDRWGTLIGGPPPTSLPLYATRIENGDLYVANRIAPRGR